MRLVKQLCLSVQMPSPPPPAGAYVHTEDTGSSMGQTLSLSMDTAAEGKSLQKKGGGEETVKFYNQIMIPSETRLKISDYSHIITYT